MKALIVIAISIAASGCAVAPTVEYTKITSQVPPTGDEIDAYFFQKSVIKIEQATPKKDAKGTDVPDFSITSVPQEFNDFKMGLRRADPPGITTNLNVTKFENTDLLKEVGVEVTDDRVKLIGQLGTIVKTVAGLPFAADKSAAPLHKTIDVNDVLAAAQKLAAETKTNFDRAAELKDFDAGDGVSIRIGAVPPDARAVSSLTFPFVYSGVVYAACRAATVSFKSAGRSYEQQLKVSDPFFYERIAFPVKGKVTMHSSCGVSVSASKDTGVSSTAEVVQAVGNAIKDALDTSTKKK